LEGKAVRETSVVLVQKMTPQDANLAGNVHGGVIMRLIDDAAYVVATRHCRCNTVTASIDRMDFHSPIYIGDLVSLKASLNFVGTTSMEIGVRVETENLKTGEISHGVSAYLTYVALDENGKPTSVPPLILETEEDKRRNTEAQARRRIRLQER
jgi:acyl-CoA hydrolase